MEMRRSFENPNSKEAEPLPTKETDPRTFEYLGNDSLILRGISTGTSYHFRSKGQRIEVNYFDSFAMMAEPELKLAS